MNTLTKGIVAGAAGTLALNAATYLDMAIRARPASSTPQGSVQQLADRAGIDLGAGEQAENRKNGLGPLLGYATGMAVTLGFAVAGGGRLPRPVSALGLTALAMVAANAPMVALGLTDPRQWSPADWAADLLPHLAYGTAAAAVLGEPE